MPKGLPVAAELWNGEISFFSIDTDLIQSAGYNFGRGALNQLPAQMPEEMSLQMSEVVCQEIINHRLAPLLAAEECARSAIKNLARNDFLELAKVDHEIDQLDIAETARNHFREEIEKFAHSCRGGILPIEGENMADKIFSLYFSGAAPFGKRKDKKSEFPDATTLLILENYAIEKDTKGIFASNDGGVAEFVASSHHLYCVNSLDDLAKLFADTTAVGQQIKQQILDGVNVPDSLLREELIDEILNHVHGSTWELGEIHSGSVHRVEGDIYENKLENYEIKIEKSKIWHVKDDRSTWIIEVPIEARVRISVDVSFFVYDYIDRDEIEIAKQPVFAYDDIKFSVFITFSGIAPDNSTGDWSWDFDIAGGEYYIDVGEVNPDFED